MVSTVTLVSVFNFIKLNVLNKLHIGFGIMLNFKLLKPVAGHGCLAQFVNNANYASVFAMELEKLFGNGKITALCQTNMYLKQYFIRYK